MGNPRPIALTLGTTLPFLLGAAACSSSSNAKDGAMVGDTSSFEDADTETDDALAPALDSEPDAEPSTLESCADFGLPVVPFSSAQGTGTLGSVAGDFSFPVLADRGFDPSGRWTLSQHFSGCDNYLFVIHRAGSTQSESVWKSSPISLLRIASRNLHVFFISSDAGEAAIADVSARAERVETALASLSPEMIARWKGRLHFVTQSAGKLDGWVGQLLRSKVAGWTAGFAIDRRQIIRQVGSWDQGLASAVPEMNHFDWEARSSAATAKDGALVLPVWSRVPAADPNWTDDSIFADVVFPDAATMAGFDTMKIELALDCDGADDSACPPWDSLVNAYLCDALDPTACQTELGRWVSAFNRPGHWVTDLSPLLGMLVEGGPRRLRFHSIQRYLVSMSIRLSNTGKGRVPKLVVPLWRGGETSTVVPFDQSYNGKHPPKTVAIPATATKVELVAFVTGHGWGKDQANCAEFCNHEHEFKVNDAAFLKSHPEAGNTTGCATRVAEGVVPNQYGTWRYGRGGWCPGLDVPLFVADVSQAAPPGASATLTYRGLFKGADYTPATLASPPENAYPAEIQLSSWLVVWQ